MEDLFLYLVGAWGFFTYGIEVALFSGNTIYGLEILLCVVSFFLFWRIGREREVEFFEALFATAPFLVLFLHFFNIFWANSTIGIVIAAALSFICSSVAFLFFGWDFFHREKFRPPKRSE